MSNITLKWAKDRKACIEAIEAFEIKFGEEATTEQVLTWLNEIDRPDWLVWVMSQDDIDITRELLSHGANVHTSNDEALRYATWLGHINAVRLLVENGADVHANNDYALRWTEGNGHTDVVEFLRQVAA